MPSEDRSSGALGFGDVVLVPFPFTDQLHPNSAPLS